MNINFDLLSVYGDPSYRTGHFGIKYREIPCVKCPFDYVLYQMLINSVKPDLIIEIGTYKGGSALYYSDLLNLLGGVREVHTIDIESNVDSDLIKNNNNIKLFTEGYQNYDINLISNFSNVMIIDDGSHTYNDVLNSLNKFSKYVSSGSYFIVEDGVITDLGLDQNFNGGPMRAIDEFLTNNDFTIDRSYCDFFGKNATFNPNGFLKKS
jgi:cephalosporin hydroxylase